MDLALRALDAPAADAIETSGVLLVRVKETGDGEVTQELIERLRELADHLGSAQYNADPWSSSPSAQAQSCRQAADALEAQASRIAEMEASQIMLHPSERGEFVGDIYFGDTANSTRGTHRWDGNQWTELPDERVSLMELLAKARARIAEMEEALAARSARDEAALADLALDYLHLAQPEFCSARCPSVGREGVPIPHLPECVSMRSLLDGLPFSTPGATISTGLMSKLKKLANYLTEQGEYEACDLIDTVVDRLSSSKPDVRSALSPEKT